MTCFCSALIRLNSRVWKIWACPVLDLAMLLFVEVPDGLRRPDAAEAVMERLVAHHQLHQAAQHGIVGTCIQRRERAHRQALDQHLHADDLLVDLGRAHEIGQHRGDGLADRQRLAPNAWRCSG